MSRVRPPSPAPNISKAHLEGFFPSAKAGGPQWTFCPDNANLGSRARYPSGKGEVCKTFTREFDSHPRLHSFFPAHYPLPFLVNVGGDSGAATCEAGL